MVQSSLNCDGAPKKSSTRGVQKHSLKVANPHGKDVDLEAIAPNGVVKVSHPKSAEFQFDARVAAISERNKTSALEIQKVKKLEAFRKASQKRASAALNNSTKKRSSTEDYSKSKPDFAAAVVNARRSKRVLGLMV